jgi:hypothetical protein
MERMGEIQGALLEPDTYVFQAISQTQADSGITGDILEIGSYLGQSAIFLGYLLQDDEALHICDSFPEPSAVDPDFLPHTLDWYNTYSQQIFEDTYLRFHAELPEIHAISSMDLPVELKPKSFRFIHLDGGHRPEVIASDIAMSKDVLVGGGVVAHDIYRSMETLEVAAAVWKEVAESSISPICATETRLYYTLTPYSSDQSADLHARLRAIPRVNVVPSEFRGVEVALVQPAPGEPEVSLKSFIPPILLPQARRVRAWARDIRSR